MGVFFIFIIIAVISGIIRMAARAQRTTGLIWQGAAGDLGLGFEPGTWRSQPRIAGQRNGLDIEVAAKTQSTGNNNQIMTTYRISYPPLGPGMKLTRQTGFSRITQAFGAQDIEIGDQSFDDAFVVKSDDPNAVKLLLTPAVRMSLLRLQTAYPGVVVEDDHIRYESSGMEKRADVITTTVRRLFGTARVLTGRSATDDISEALTIRQQGQLGESTARLRTVAAQDPADLESRMLEAEALATSGDTAEASAVLDELATLLPADTEVEGWRRSVEARTTPPTPTPTAAPAPGRPAAGDGPSAETVATTLFTETALSYESNDLFEKEFQGARVTWTGELKSIRAYQYDADFGDEPGVKAVVTIASVQHDLYGNTSIDAVVALPPGTEHGRERHDTVTITGVLTKVDPLMRNIFIEDATLA
jgi:hypothetical protein